MTAKSVKSKKTNAKTDPPWWEGGNLHKKTIKEWHDATFGNCLATVSDMLVALVKTGKTKIITISPDTLLPYCLQIMYAVTESTSNPKTHHLKISELVLLAAAQLDLIDDAG